MVKNQNAKKKKKNKSHLPNPPYPPPQNTACSGKNNNSQPVVFSVGGRYENVEFIRGLQYPRHQKQNNVNPGLIESGLLIWRAVPCQ